jgi:hypothetical protein
VTLPRTVAEVLSDHVIFEVESIDRMLLHVYQPRLQYAPGVSNFFVKHRGHRFAGSVLMKQITDVFVADLHHWITANDVELVHFRKGERKDDIAQRYLVEAATAGGCRVDQLPEQVLFVGRAQEKTWVWRTEKRRNNLTGASYAWLVKDSAMVNHFYLYVVDDDFGPLFIKFCSYFPYNIKVCLNGNEYAKRQVAKAGIGFTALDNAFAAVDDPAAVQAICRQLTAEKIEALVFKWLARLPHPFTGDDHAAGYEYDISILQAEFSLTQMLDRPLTGRIFFDQLIRDNLDIGRPDKVGLVFDRQIHHGRKKPTPGRFRTRVLADNSVIPSLHVDYKTGGIKQYHKGGRALRTETTINNPNDLAIGKRLSCLPQLEQVGYQANRRLLDVQRISHDPADGQAVLDALTRPVITDTGQRIPGLRPADPRAHALLAALCIFGLLPNGFTNRDLRTRVAPLLGVDSMTSGQMTYDLRRLAAHGLIERITGTFRYRVTTSGLTQARYLTRLHTRLWRTGLAQLTDPDPPVPTPLRAADRAYQAAIDDLIHTGLAA